MISLIIWIAILGLIVYAVTTFIPMAPPFKNLIYIIAGICCLLILLNAFGLGDAGLPRLR
jgi:hypothetical protein